MVENTKSALAAFSSPGSLPLLVPAAGGGGLRLEAVMENLQRQQAARLARGEEKLRRGQAEPGPGQLRSVLGSRIQQYRAAVRCGLPPRGRLGGSPPGPGAPEHAEEEEDLEGEAGAARYPPRSPSAPQQRPEPARSLSPPRQPPPQHHEWTYEEQFKQLYDLDDDPKRKEFLDDLFGFMQKRGTPVNRIPIMAKQVLDLYVLYRLVTEKGGLVEVINKKIWREITKGLNLPTSITSAAFTLRTQYMKYLYPYECERQALSSPGELQAAIDSNRREGRRQSFGTALFSYSPVGTPAMLASPKIPVPALAISTHSCNQMSQAHAIKKEDGILSAAVPSRIAIPVSLAGHHIAAAQAAAASQAAALEQLREKLEAGEPPEKKMALMAEEQQRLMQHALQQNLLAMASQFPMNIKLSSRADDRQETALNLSTNGISSINMSIEINGVVYAGSVGHGVGVGTRTDRWTDLCCSQGGGRQLPYSCPLENSPSRARNGTEIPESERSFAVHKRPSVKPAGKVSLMPVGWQKGYAPQ
ncbi:AT-rich interactive domain-containing protein 3C [Gopherus flavomarginatus]|uniref:AT-rich interactive domain-containing protein 3C n=1 Tax=Gopherus flavomarginatus TaxID=286002 RepID=UPI0021CBDA7A|nr:AT-rich interactive domain-containing protein 3C [Gopherus flavomarginatus]